MTESKYNEETKAKIFISYHKPFTLLSTEIFTPIHCGRAIAKKNCEFVNRCNDDENWMLDNIKLGDDEGDNISNKNQYFCEMTSVYWVWKNYLKKNKLDYVGFMHYRRHLCFDLKNNEHPDKFGQIYYENLDDNYVTKNKLNDQVIRELIKDYDIVTTEATDLQELGTGTVYNHYLSSNPDVLHIEDYDKALEVLYKKYPEYKKAADIYNRSKYAYFTNMYIFKVDIFLSFADWIFNILLELEPLTLNKLYNQQESRAIGYISEFLFGIWLTHEKINSKLRIQELKRTFITNTEFNQIINIKPAFEKNNIPVFFSVDEQYFLSFSVVLESIISNSSEKYNYDLIILHSSIPKHRQQQLMNVKKENFSIRFISITNLYKKHSNMLYESGHILKEAYARIIGLELFYNYDKIIYLDSDIIVNKDLSYLYQTNIDKYYLAAARDYEIIRISIKDNFFQESYIKTTLGLKDMMDYFNSGVIIFNINEVKKNFLVDKCLDFLNKIKTPIYHDQDILNNICKGKVLFLEPKWNVLYHIPIFTPLYNNQLPLLSLNEYLDSLEEPYIIHFAGCKKPWKYPEYRLSEYFWKYAKKSEFYHEILHNYINNK